MVCAGAQLEHGRAGEEEEGQVGVVSMCKTRVFEIVEVRVLVCCVLFSIPRTPHMCYLYVLDTLYTFYYNTSPSSPICDFCPGSLGSYPPSATIPALHLHGHPVEVRTFAARETVEGLVQGASVPNVGLRGTFASLHDALIHQLNPPARMGAGWGRGRAPRVHPARPTRSAVPLVLHD